MVNDLALKVHCNNIDAGCEEEATLEQMEEHEMECGFRPIQCVFGCERSLEYRNYSDHFLSAHDYPEKSWTQFKCSYPVYIHAWEDPKHGHRFHVTLALMHTHGILRITVHAGRKMAKSYR